MIKSSILTLLLLVSRTLFGQDYYLKKFIPYQPEIPSPEAYLGYPVGSQHTRHDLIVSYFKELASLSDRASFYQYGKTHEGRSLVILTVTTPDNISNLETIKQDHLKFTDPNSTVNNYDEVPVFVNLGYNVHGNEPSSSEAALLIAYTLVASQNQEILNYLGNAVIFIDPTINPDGRDRHTQWANMYKGNPLVEDPQDAEHNEYWPGGRTNHYWFDLNRDWLLGINPESRGKLNWYHDWYPNVVTDFHEMSVNSTYFFEPMKVNGSKDPIMPKENYIDLNNLFGAYFAKALDSIGIFYFSKENFDGTYPGYGSSYPDLQGGLGLLFEQAGSKGHAQTTDYGKITFPYTIRNQYLSSIITIKAAVENKPMLRKYQQDFFKSGLDNAAISKIAGYTFYDDYDPNRVKAFIDKLLLHRIRVFKSKEKGYVVPTNQPQYRLVQTVFETYSEFTDSVFYDASAWSLANFYNMKYMPVTGGLNVGDKVENTNEIISIQSVSKSDYAYLISWDDYNAPAVLHYLQDHGVTLASAFKPFTATIGSIVKSFGYGTLMLPVSKQEITSDSVFNLLVKAQNKFEVPMYGVLSGYSNQGIDLGSRYMRTLKMPKVAMLIGDGVRSNEAGEVWHLLDTRVSMPVTKIPIRNFNKASIDQYNTLVLVSGNYERLDSVQQKRIQIWVDQGNTLITIGTATKWVVEKKMVKETLIKEEKDSTKTVNRKPLVDAVKNIRKEWLTGAIFEVSLDTTHPLGFGYRDSMIPVYKNNTVWLSPSKNAYATVAKYTNSPHIDGFITSKNLNVFLKPSASLIVSKMGKGRAVLFADNPNFRGSWYGTNRLFLNALFLGSLIKIPEPD